MTPKISIVVPVYNLELYVERCLESLVGQTLQDIEILVVDDGSRDDSPLLIREIAERHPRLVRNLVKPNGGHGSACNHGIEHASGEYVMIVDGDDFLDPDTAEFMYEKAKQVDADMLVGNLRYIFSTHTNCHRPIDIDSERMLDEADWSALFENWATPCARLYRRSLFADPAVRFAPGILFADVNFSPKSYLAARRIYYVNKELYNYDVTRPTQSLKQTDKRILDVVAALRDMLQFYVEKRQFEASRAELLRYSVRHCVAWLSKVQTLHGYPKHRALVELFAVLDEYFGEEWRTSGVLRAVAGPRRALLLRAARHLEYAPIVWGWSLRATNSKIERRAERILSLPAKAYRKFSQKLDHFIFSRLAV